MRRTTALILVAALAGCGSGQKAGNAAAAPAANAAAPAAPAPANTLAAPAPAAPAAGEAAGVAEFRDETYRGCVEGGNETAPGMPIAQICTCATDRAMAGRSLARLEAEPTADFERRFRADVDACVDEVGG